MQHVVYENKGSRLTVTVQRIVQQIGTDSNPVVSQKNFQHQSAKLTEGSRSCLGDGIQFISPVLHIVTSERVQELQFYYSL